MQIRLYNTLAKSIQDFRPLNGNTVRIYSCGPTVYNVAHMGNMRAFLCNDLLQRVLRVVGGYQVRWVMNITDIDDKTIRDSALNAPTWLSPMGHQSHDARQNLRTFTSYYYGLFLRDITMLGILPEDFEAMPRATDYIESMKSLITRIHSNGFAYIDEGSVYFDLARWRDEHPYGVLFNVDPTAIVKGARISADEYSREEVSDFVLWKAAKPNEPFWEFELGGHRLPGRPGWHIECSAMGHDLLGLPFDIHTGGVDLRFPHHEDEIAQSAAGYGDQTAAFWVHNEFLEVEGAKMSKSAGNFYTLQDLIAKKLDPLDIRFAFLSVHYASVFNFTFTGLEASRKARMRVQDYIYKLHEKSSGTTAFDVASLRREVFEHLADNLHSPKALERLFSHINGEQPDSVDARSKEALLDFFTEINNIFGVWTIAERPVIQIPVEVVNLAKKRLQAKRDRDFPGADALRNEILSHGFQVRDTKDGFELTPVEG